MSQNLTEFNRGVVAPVECLKEAWELIKAQYWLVLGICVVGLLIGSAFAIILMGPMMCGVYYCLFQHMRGEKVSFENLFKGFDYFGQAVIATLIQTIPAVIIIVPVYLIMVVAVLASAGGSRGRGSDDAMMAGVIFAYILIFVLMFLVGLIMGIFFMFTYPLIVDRKLSGVEAVKTSIKAAMGNFWGVVGLVFLNAVLNFAGLLVCYVGAVFVLPVTMTAVAIAYRRVFPEIPSSFVTPPPPPASWAA